MSTAWLEPDWLQIPGVRVISTFRTGGVSVGRYASLNLGDHVDDEPAAVAANRQRLVLGAKLPAPPHWLTQVHGVRVANLDTESGPIEADAAVTSDLGRPCAILTADCLPVVLSARSGEVVAAAHAGWRGLAAGVLEATVKAMLVAPSTVVAWLGPAIGPAHFEVGADVREAFRAQDLRDDVAFQRNARGRFLADLPRLAKRRLEDLGVQHVFESMECTHADPSRYFSHRRDGITGRQATLIWREAG